jgi:putative SOS response-associated peptidase YedK
LNGCGRYVVKSPSSKLKVKFHPDDAPLFEPRYNVAPTQLVPAVRQEDGKRRLAMLRWGLIPSWAKDAKIGYRLINPADEMAAYAISTYVNNPRNQGPKCIEPQ